jgi:short-subunit dehydrogenase
MSLELESENIDVTSVHPVVTRTEFFDGASERLDRSSVFDHSPSLFVQTAEHVARRVVGALKRPCREVWPARWARWAVELAVLFHWITRKLLRRHAEDDRKIIAAGKKATADAPAVEAGSTKKAGSSVTSSAGQ